MNGIAIEPESGQLLLTGKLWPGHGSGSTPGVSAS